MAGRVISKNLFNFRLQGMMDPELAANNAEAEQKMINEMNVDPKEFVEQIKMMKDEDFGAMLDGMMGGMVATIFNHPIYQEGDIDM